MAELSVTIKYGKGYEESWAVFRAERADLITQQLIEYFGLNSEAAREMSLHDLVLEVTKIAHGTSSISSVLGGSVIQAGESSQPPWEGKSAWEQAQEPEEQVNPLRVAINNCATTDALYAIWADHQAELSADTELLNAWKAKGKSLEAAA